LLARWCNFIANVLTLLENASQNLLLTGVLHPTEILLAWFRLFVILLFLNRNIVFIDVSVGEIKGDIRTVVLHWELLKLILIIKS
jgi:hypothetical protein